MSGDLKECLKDFFFRVTITLKGSETGVRGRCDHHATLLGQNICLSTPTEALHFTHMSHKEWKCQSGFTLLTFSDASGGGVSVRSFIMSTSET